MDRLGEKARLIVDRQGTRSGICAGGATRPSNAASLRVDVTMDKTGAGGIGILITTWRG